MIEFEKRDHEVVFHYDAEVGGGDRWTYLQLRDHGEVTISRAFHFKAKDLIDPLPASPEVAEGHTFSFRFGGRADGYVRIDGRILGIANTVLISEEIELSRKLFVAVRDTSIFRRIAQLVGPQQVIAVGGPHPVAIPARTYADLLRQFPNTTELNKYAASRVATVLRDHLQPLKDAKEEYELYLNRRATLTSLHLEQQALIQAEFDKYVYIRKTIAQWLKTETNRPEREWQQLLLQFLLLIFPKYVAVLENVTISDFYSTPGKRRRRFIDLALVDAGGNLDVIEVKKPFDDALVSKTTYRDNSIPARELAGSIMQAEKYLFHLSKWGVDGEAALTKAYGAKLPGQLDIRITSPKAMIIIGRDCRADGAPALDAAQMFDLEVIKRKYANMMDIMTYDDLLRRLDNIIASLRARGAVPKPQ